MKRQILEKFIKEHSHLSEQGSKEWLEERQFVIGGSEIATVIGKNRFSTIQDLVSRKIGISHFSGNTATRWGSLFEDMTQLIFQILLLKNDTVYTTGSVPHKEITSHRYSPDGICLMEILNVLKIVLLEFKAPLSSIPEGKIPIYYLPQIKAGLCTLDITENAVFMNNMFRKCSLAQLDFGPSYDSLFHKDKNKKINLTQALACGIIVFYIPGQKIDSFLSNLLDEKKELEMPNSDDEDDVAYDQKHEFAATDEEDSSGTDADLSDAENEEDKTLLQRLHKNVSLFLNTEMDPEEYDMLDVGELYPGEMDEWLKLYKPEASESFLKAKYIKPNFNSEALMEDNNLYISKELENIRKKSHIDTINKKYNFTKTIHKFKANCLKNGYIPVAVLPWKLMKSDIILLDKDENYLDDHRDAIDSVIEKIKYITANGSDLDEKVTLFENLYPDSKIAQEYWDNKPLSLDEIKEFIL